MSNSDAIVALSRAEQALTETDNIIEMMELRTKAKAVEVIAIAQGYEELAQTAKAFQLKAERKAGSWLSNNIRPGNPYHDGRVTLSDLDISHNQSSRWQLMSTIPEERFNAWVDDKLARGYEITAGGCREYARNIKGIPPTKRTNICPRCGHQWEN